MVNSINTPPQGQLYIRRLILDRQWDWLRPPFLASRICFSEVPSSWCLPPYPEWGSTWVWFRQNPLFSNKVMSNAEVLCSLMKSKVFRKRDGPLLSAAITVGVIWVFKQKFNADRSLGKKKARLTASTRGTRFLHEPVICPCDSTRRCSLTSRFCGGKRSNILFGLGGTRWRWFSDGPR